MTSWPPGDVANASVVQEVHRPLGNDRAACMHMHGDVQVGTDLVVDAEGGAAGSREVVGAGDHRPTLEQVVHAESLRRPRILNCQVLVEVLSCVALGEVPVGTAGGDSDGVMATCVRPAAVDLGADRDLNGAGSPLRLLVCPAVYSPVSLVALSQEPIGERHREHLQDNDLAQN
jgi:hypothetical protein